VLEEFSAERTSTLQQMLLAAGRLVLLMALPLEGIQGYGDFPHFFDLAWLAVDGGGGWPFIGHWVEFPPLFPFLSIGVFRLAGGLEHRYVYLLSLILALFDLGNLYLFQRLAKRLLPIHVAHTLGWIYAFFLLLPAFGWWTFEPIGIFFALLTFELMLEDKPLLAGFTGGIGFLTKLIPALSVIGFAGRRRWRSLVISVMVLLFLSAVVMIPLLRTGGEVALASMRAQFTKGSWETIWALIDGNLTTGSYGPIEDHLQIDEAVIALGAPARIPHWIPTLFAAGFGMWIFLRSGRGEIDAVRLVTTAWCVVFLWSRGWSPQWLAYLTPFLLLTLPVRQSLLYLFSLMMTSLAEWPLLLSRGRFDLLWVTVPLRTLALLLLIISLTMTIVKHDPIPRGAS